MMQAMVSNAEPQMTDLEDDQIDFDRVVTDPDYRRDVIVYLNAQARRRESGRPTVMGKMLRPEPSNYLPLRRLG
jgi:hypothetical protein